MSRQDDLEQYREEERQQRHKRRIELFSAVVALSLFAMMGYGLKLIVDDMFNHDASRSAWAQQMYDNGHPHSVNGYAVHERYRE